MNKTQPTERNFFPYLYIHLNEKEVNFVSGRSGLLPDHSFTAAELINQESEHRGLL